MIRKANREDIASVVKIYDAILDKEEAGNVRIGWVRGCIRRAGPQKMPWQKGHCLSVKMRESLSERQKSIRNRFRNMRTAIGHIRFREIK